MVTSEERDEMLWTAIETGKLDETLASDRDLAQQFAAYQKLERFFEMLREPVEEACEKGDLAAGTEIGRYQVRRVLGQGAFGVVYLADDPELGRPVAIKVQRPGRFASQADAERFLAEARSAARLNHPGIVTVYDVAHNADGCYIVMEYVQGRTLEDAMRSEPMPLAEGIALLARVVDALHYAHKRGFVHRDLKPGNILIDEHGCPHVTDFGLAVSEDTQRLQAGQVAGTPAYMSPEQVRGETHRLDGRSDIWSLGVILYELLAGRPPFRPENVMECLDEILNREPKPPRQIDDSVPGEVERIALKCLAKQPTDRYNTAADLAADLRRWQSSLPGAVVAHGKRMLLLRRAILGSAAAIAAIAILALVIRFTSPRGQQSSQPLTGSIDVQVWDPKDPERRGLSLTDPGALPLRTGDQVRLQVSVSRPSYLYVVWIDADGQPAPVYPWERGDWGSRPDQEQPISALSLPQERDRGWSMKGPAGAETLLLLARATPLPRDVSIGALLSDFPRPPLQDARTVVRMTDQGVQRQTDRGPELSDPHRIEDPELFVQRFLATRLTPHFQLLHGIRFANGAGQKP